jgi:hypothetical protein
MQKFEKILSKTSSVAISPVIEDTAAAAVFTCSAAIS